MGEGIEVQFLIVELESDSKAAGCVDTFGLALLDVAMLCRDLQGSAGI